MERKVTQKLFDCVKTLIDSGATYEEISAFLKISKYTVGRINKAQDLAEYKHNTSAAAWMAKRDANLAKKNAEKIEPEKTAPVLTDMKMPGGTISANYQVNRMYELLKKQTETLIQISNKLAFIVCELGGGENDDAGGQNPAVS